MGTQVGKHLKGAFQWLWWYYFYIALGLLFIGFYPVFRYLIAKPHRHRKAYWLRHKLTKFYLRINGIRIKQAGASLFAKKGPVILCSNHFSDIDILVLLAAFQGPYAFLGKYELGQYPLFGTFFKTLDIAVNRNDPRKASASFKKAQERLRAGQSIVIFPEGGIHDAREVLKPFKSGAFIMAVQNGVPIQPLTILGSNRVIDPYKAKGGPGLITIKIHEPVRPGEKTAEKLREEVFEIINSGLK